MKKHRILIVSVFFLVFASLLANFSDLITNKSHYAKELETILSQKIEKVHRHVNLFHKGLETNIASVFKSLDKEGIILLTYQSDSLVFWSSNSIPIYEKYDEKIFSSRIIEFFDSYYYCEKFKLDSTRYIGLVNIYNNYPYENDFLKTGFYPDFQVSEGATISFTETDGFDIRDKNQNYLFSIQLSPTKASINPRMVISTLLLFLGLILLGYVLLSWMIKYYERQGNLIYIFLIVIGVLVFRVLQLIFSFNISGFLLFDPYIYAESSLAPSLGDLFINSLLVFLIAIIIAKFYIQEGVRFKSLKTDSTLLQVVLNLVFLLFFLHAHYISYSLIFNSNISFQPNTINQLSVYSLIGFLINGVNYSSAGIIFIWLLRMTKLKENLFKLLQIYILTSASFFAIVFLIFYYPLDIISVVFFYLFSFIIGVLKYSEKDLSRYSPQVLFLLLYSIFSFIFINIKEQEKESIIKSSLVLSLANEHDPVAEYLFEELSRQIEQDTIISNQYCRKQIDEYVFPLDNYLKKKYFSGFWNKYILQAVLCRPQDSLLFEDPEIPWFPCYEFFDGMINDRGSTLPDSRFYYLDNYTGRISYLGKFPYEFEGEDEEVSMFIELYSHLSNDFLGYPELLLDKKLHEDRLIEKYSYAKYHQGNLVSQYGDFSYSLSSDLFGDMNNEFETVKLDGYSHLLYKSEQDSLIVLSLPTVKFIDLLIGFSYVFLFYYICLVLILAVQNIQHPDVRLLANLRSKIQFSILTILVLSLILIAASTIWLSVRSYRQRQHEILQEKIQSVLVELSHKLDNEDELSPDWNAPKYDNLNQLLIKFSDVFYTDINMYDPGGNLLATSRFEVFEVGLQGEKINPLVYNKLHKEKRAQFIHREKIGELDFLSAYVPFNNANGKLLAYLNLPYFTKQKALQESLAALIVTIVNIYVILILITIVLTILISDQITRPLELLQLRFRELKLGNKYDQIVYKRKDEIGGLVTEYNNMVLELERSVKLLARSERESAWREMAKQIAHEIKNPLTPMRLSIQQLNKIWVEKPEDFDKYLSSVTSTLIEQIDNLSTIASEFSNFAKMPVAKFEKTDLIDKLKRAIKLFQGNKHISISLESEHETLIINADKEQLSRVFINIIKNGIQSIPDNRQGEIKIHVETQGEFAVVKIKDNGKGIPEEIRSKLFMPNFTTKTSGMGLGLAIVKNIIEHMNGEIDFETKLDEGSIFLIHLPLYK